MPNTKPLSPSITISQTIESTQQPQISQTIENTQQPINPDKEKGNKKSGRPPKPKNDASRSWTDGERQKSLESIESVLKENEIIKQISKKLTDLKNYYG